MGTEIVKFSFVQFNSVSTLSISNSRFRENRERGIRGRERKSRKDGAFQCLPSPFRVLLRSLFSLNRELLFVHFAQITD
jgi:hypothetical protein